MYDRWTTPPRPAWRGRTPILSVSSSMRWLGKFRGSSFKRLSLGEKLISTIRYYTWSANLINADLEFVPLLWGTKFLDQFSSTIQSTLSQTRPIITAVLGMNEYVSWCWHRTWIYLEWNYNRPDQAGQSNLTALEGAQMWKSYLEPLRVNGVRLGSPAISSAPTGKTWLQDFFTVCAGNCTVDFIALRAFHSLNKRYDHNHGFH